ncbi:netrin receptor DCC-like [Eriocheir sinensis]|uniref:netrin receptor DCC-like n=1 Tax=Eriocheir sinensis TaxID=95602 RepID=UPI0021C57621|nr:netrin receptor DCC-like [Eriocheir sinensis]
MESLDYDNSAWLDEERTQGYMFVVKKDAARWLVVLLTVLVVCGIDIAIKSLSKCKYSWLQMYSDCGVQQEALTLPYPLFVALNIGPALVAAFLGSYVEPVAAGSGIPQVKCYLNGAKVSRVVRIKTLMSKAVGVTFSVLGGRAMGEVRSWARSVAVTTKMLLPTVLAMAKGRVARTTDDGPLLDKEDLDTLFCGTSSSSLHIHGLQEEDEGTYRCRAENREDSLDAVAHIQVQVAPRFLRQPANALAYEKENVELECSVYGQPEPSLHWLKNGELLVETEYLQRTRPERECSSSSEGRDEYKTQISDLSPGSNYMVRVAAHTSGGLVGASIHEVRCSPSRTWTCPPPQSLKVVSTSPTSLEATWSPPVLAKTPITGYTMFYTQFSPQVGSAEEHEVKVTGTSHDLQGLDQFTEHSVWLTAVNSNGGGDATLEVTARTFSDVPSKEPQNVSVEAASSRVSCGRLPRQRYIVKLVFK